MKKVKIFLPLVVLIFAVAGVFAKKANSKVNNTYATTLYFHYVPNTMSDAQYTTATNWQESSPQTAGCGTLEEVTCLVDVQDADIASQPGTTSEERFANFLDDQSSATNYIAQHLVGTKAAQ